MANEMDEGNQISLVALVISLIALAISLLQLVQQFLGTADGYRRCRREVIGAWSKKTHRHWNFYEFRAEVQFSVPDVDIIELPADGKLPSTKDQGPYLLNSVSPLHEIDHTVHKPKRTNVELQASWIELLRKLHDVYLDYRPNQCKCGTKPKVQAIQGTSEEKRPLPGSESPAQARPAKASVSPASHVVINYRRLSWDFMPDDALRPLASTRLGPLVVLVLRLGMRWSDMHPKGEAIEAAGNGYNITSTMIRGLGIAIQFSKDVGTSHQIQTIPSIAADKMLCGLIPGDIDLVKRDYEVLGADRKPSLIRTVLQELRASKEAVDLLADPELLWKTRMAWYDRPFRRTGFNDIVCLLSPFMPLEDSVTFTVRFLGWCGMQSLSVFTSWPARKALMRGLAEKIERKGPNEASPDLVYVHDQLTALEEKWYGDFYCRPEMALIFGADKENEETHKGKELVDDCRRIFNHTQSYFVSLQRGDEKAKMPPVQYVDLIGAHASMAAPASIAARTRWFDADKKESNYKIGDRRGGHLHQEAYEIAKSYVECIPKFITDVKERVTEAGRGNIGDERDGKIEEMWWMMMLRGIVWAMSVNIADPSDAVPSSLYKSRTPIWIN